jgi:predicted nucleic acid-binding protein
MFLDTSGLLSLYDVRESDHAVAMDLFHSAERRVTTNYVLAELMALMIARRVGRAQSIRYVTGIEQDPLVEIVWVSQQTHGAAMDLLRRRLDKDYSLCDAVSFVVMRDEGIAEALTTDHHFEQEGFVCLLG